MNSERFNILYLHSHDTGRYIQPYGHAIPTPNLQRLAEEGVLFRQAFCAGPTCSPSRAGLLTGQCAHSAGMIGLARRGFKLTDPNQHLAHTLRRHGYHTILTGVQHVGQPEACGYEIIRKEQEQAAIEYLRSAPRQPFFLDVGFIETHRVGRGFSRPEHNPGDGDANSRYCLPPPSLPDTPQTRQDMADFKTSAARLDQKYGLVLGALREAGLAENTLVLCTTDHGIAFPDMKCNLTDHGIGVLLILRGPGEFTGGRVCDALVSQLDVFPTLCELLGIETPAWLQGKSFRPALRGEEIHEEIFSEVTFHAAFEPKRCVRTRRYKYIRNYDSRRRVVLPNCDESVSKDLWMAHGWREHTVPDEELYDLVFDPQEQNNLTDAGILREMRDRLQAWMRRTNDPLLGTTLPVPPDAKVNNPNGVSPGEPSQPSAPVTWC